MRKNTMPFEEVNNRSNIKAITKKFREICVDFRKASSIATTSTQNITNNFKDEFKKIDNIAGDIFDKVNQFTERASNALKVAAETKKTAGKIPTPR